jgi:hypothetical protein
MAETATSNRVHDLETIELKLAQVRDELRLKIHLARADARDEWDAVEQKWAGFRTRLKALREATGEAREDVWDGVRALGREIGEGYERIRRAL